MKFFDRLLQKWRINKVVKYIPDNAHVLDVGCFNGELFGKIISRLGSGVGIDPLFDVSLNVFSSDKVLYIKGYFPHDLPEKSESFDVITALAVFEHIPDASAQEFIASCYDALKKDGRLIMTVPSPSVDKLLGVLQRLHIVDGMSAEEHHKLPTGDISQLFAHNGFALSKHKPFQFGLNNLFVFEKMKG
jgi:SAM-dependent methyltransferase